MLDAETRGALDVMRQRNAYRDACAEMAAALSDAASALAWAALVIGDIPPRSHFMETLETCRKLAAKGKQ